MIDVGDRVYYDLEQREGIVVKRQEVGGIVSFKVKWSNKFFISQWIGEEYLRRR